MDLHIRSDSYSQVGVAGYISLGSVFGAARGAENTARKYC